MLDNINVGGHVVLSIHDVGDHVIHGFWFWKARTGSATTEDKVSKKNFVRIRLLGRM